jgi:predicted DNA-binding ribbon-helix-helix protein
MVDESKLLVERVQTGVRMEKRILKVLKAFAEYHDLTLGDLLEGIVLHAFDGKTPFNAASLARIRDLKKFYELHLDSGASHHLVEGRGGASPKKPAEKKNRAETTKRAVTTKPAVTPKQAEKTK